MSGRPASPRLVHLLTEHGPDARLLAGRQSLMPAMNLRLASPSVLIDIGRIGGLDGIERRVRCCALAPSLVMKLCCTTRPLPSMCHC